MSVLLESGDETASSRVICSTLKPKSDGRTGLFRWTLPPTKATETRRTFLERFADTSTLVLGSHFGTPTGNYIQRDGDSFKLVPAKD